MSELWVASLIALWVLVLLLGFLLMGALRQIGLMQLRLGPELGALVTDDGLDRGAQAPDFTGIDVDTNAVRSLSELPARQRLLVFLSPSCVACSALAPHLNEVSQTWQDEFDFLVVCRGNVEGCRVFRQRHRLRAPMLVDVSGQIEHAYQVTRSPFAYVLDREGRVLIRGLANDWSQLEALLAQEGTLEAGKTWAIVGSEGR